MGSFHQRKWSDNKQYAVEVRWDIFIESLTYFFIFHFFLRAVVNIPIQTLIISPWPLLRKIIISQLELGPPVHDLDLVSLRGEKNLMDINPTKQNHIRRSTKLFSWAPMKIFVRDSCWYFQPFVPQRSSQHVSLRNSLWDLRWRN